MMRRLFLRALSLLCPHRHEMWDRVNGRSVLRCADCFRERPNILADAEPKYRLTQPGRPSEAQTWRLYERQCAGERVRAKYARTA